MEGGLVLRSQCPYWSGTANLFYLLLRCMPMKIVVSSILADDQAKVVR